MDEDLIASAPAPEPVAAPPAPEPAAAPSPATSAPDAPKSMLEAITLGLTRDESGRFKSLKSDAPVEPGKPAAAGLPVTPAAPGAPAAPKPAEPAAPEDPTAMPEGLGAKAQERFQKLAGTVKELTGQVEQRDQQLAYVRDMFTQNGVERPEFEMAVNFIGAAKRGDYATAEKILLGQLQQLSLLTGKTYGGAVDALADMPDLRQAVDRLEITEQHAIELARARQTQHAQQQQALNTRQQVQQSQAAEQEFTQAQSAVDAFCREMQTKDIDYPAIEAQLLPDLKALLANVPPRAWPQAVQAQYQLLKRAAGTFRRAAPAGAVDTTPLRATGAASPAARPQTMEEAMWGKRLSA